MDSLSLFIGYTCFGAIIVCVLLFISYMGYEIYKHALDARRSYKVYMRRRKFKVIKGEKKSREIK